MRRLPLYYTLMAMAGAALLALALVVPIAAGRSNLWDGWNAGGDPVSIDQAREQAAKYLDDAGYGDLAIGEVMEFSNHVYATVVNPETGAGAFELLISRDGRAVHPEPTMMWNTEYSPMLGRSGNMMGSGMMSGGTMGSGMMSGGMMGSVADPGQRLDVPLTIEEAEARAQSWLDENRSGLSATDPIAFPGYVTLHTERDGQITGMLSVQLATGGVWEHTWHADFIAVEHGA